MLKFHVNYVTGIWFGVTNGLLKLFYHIKVPNNRRVFIFFFKKKISRYDIYRLHITHKQTNTNTVTQI